jgi:ADP-heptose:LPS heptosyltransferase
MPRLLFITSTRIGDAVLSTAALEHARALSGADQITIACGAPAAPLFRATPGVEAVHIIAQEKNGGHWFKLYNALKDSGPWDMAVDIRGSLTTLFLPVKKRFIFRKRKGLHKLDEFAAIFGKDVTITPKLYLDDKARADAAAAVPNDKPLLIMGLGASNISKSWPPDHFELFARAVTEDLLPHARIVLIGSPEEGEKLNAPLEKRLNMRNIDTVNVAGKLDLPASAALIERAALFVGNDTGPGHIAAALGVPTLVLFGPSDETFYGPRGTRARAVRGPRSVAQIAADGYERWVHTKSWMDDLTVETVLAAARDLLKAKP